MQPTPEPKPATLDVELFLALLLAATRDAEGYKKTVARLQAESNKELHRHRRWWNKLKAAVIASRADERRALTRANELEALVHQTRRDVAEFMRDFNLTLGDNEQVRDGLKRTRVHIKSSAKVMALSVESSVLAIGTTVNDSLKCIKAWKED